VKASESGASLKQDELMQARWGKAPTPKNLKLGPLPKGCVCMNNDQGKRFCCTRKTSTVQFLWQFTLWSIKSCTVSVAAAAKCLWYAGHYLGKVGKVVKCFVQKTHKHIKNRSLDAVLKDWWEDVKASFKYVFGGAMMNEVMLDGGRYQQLKPKDLDTEEKRLVAVVKAFFHTNDVLTLPHSTVTDKSELENLLDDAHGNQDAAGWNCG
jgi:hypothetical protein